MYLIRGRFVIGLIRGRLQKVIGIVICHELHSILGLWGTEEQRERKRGRGEEITGIKTCIQSRLTSL